MKKMLAVLILNRTNTGWVLLIALIIMMICTIHVAALPTVMFPLKPSPITGPYQDAEFLTIANETIYGLSNQTIPNGTTLRELQTTQQKLAKMNISPDLYPRARQINAYLYYTSKAGDAYSDAMSLASKPYSPAYTDSSVTSEAKEYQIASQVIWNQIMDLYPGVSPYRLETSKTPYSPNEDPTFKWPYDPVQTYAIGDLW
ncbi:hypothetical protein [Methanospirillum lacunae]|uniref:Uncharacterized protein n=1 Tax=Methanospirillum lacunae TaxID=668570 RepID=A0A2V2MU01_9EURY|nr:hypothetical protein [Methanospirillum lacunae]PWR70889.1 hypothetical protein DK846_12925 [Methanospirillum lacunae]